MVLPTDVAHADQVEAAAAAVEARFGPIDTWINNAMASVFSPIKATTPEEFRRVTEVTYLGYVYGTLAALRRMLPRDRGVIVQVGSALAYRGIPLQAAYCGAKHAIQGFTDSLRCELLHDDSGVRVTEVQMPALNTPQFGWVKSRLPRKPQPVPSHGAGSSGSRRIAAGWDSPSPPWWPCSGRGSRPPPGPGRTVDRTRSHGRWAAAREREPVRLVQAAANHRPLPGGASIAGYPALYQLRLVASVWEPFFGEGRMVIRFGLAVGPLGAVSILLVILQPVLFDAWCTLCLASAAISLAMIGPALDEVLASLQHLQRVRRSGGSGWRAFWGMATEGRGRPTRILHDRSQAG